MRALVGPCTPVDILVLPDRARLGDDRRERSATYREAPANVVPGWCEISDAEAVSDVGGAPAPPGPGPWQPLLRRSAAGPDRAVRRSRRRPLPAPVGVRRPARVRARPRVRPATAWRCTPRRRRT